MNGSLKSQFVFNLFCFANKQLSAVDSNSEQERNEIGGMKMAILNLSFTAQSNAMSPVAIAISASSSSPSNSLLQLRPSLHSLHSHIPPSVSLSVVEKVPVSTIRFTSLLLRIWTSANIFTVREFLVILWKCCRIC